MVFHLLQLEWKKLISYRLFQILISLYLLLLPLAFLVGKNINLPQETGGTISFYTFPKVWEALGYAGNWMAFFFLGFLGVIMVTNEFSFKTLRQNIITGMSRQEYFMGKILMMLAISFFAALYYAIVSLAVGYYFTDYILIGRVWQHLDLIPRFFLMCFAYMNFAFFLGILLRRTGLALFLYFIYTLVIEMVLRYLVHMHVFGKDSPSRNYYPLNAFEDLVPFPIREIGPATEFGNFYLNPTQAIFIALAYTSLFLLFSYLLFTKKDL